MNLSHNLASILTAEELQLLEKRNLLTPLEKILDRYSRNFANFAITKGQLKSLFGLENRDLEDPSETQNELEVQLFDEVDYGLDSLDIGFENLGQSLNLKKNNDPISSMFDIYLDNSQLATSIDYQANSWQIREIDWTNCNFLDECVILYRTHSQSRALEEAFLKHKLPYRLVSGIRFLDRKEIKDVLSMLRFLANGDDKLALNRFLPLVMDGVGAKTLEKILLFLEDPEYPLAAKYQEQIMSLLEKLQKTWLKHTSLAALTKELLIITGYENYLRSEHPDKKEFEQKMENIAELYSIMLPFDQEKDLDLVGKLAAFLSQVLLMSQAETKENEIEEEGTKEK